MTLQDRKYLVRDITETRKLTIAQLLDILKYTFNTLMYVLITFGKNSHYINECLNIFSVIFKMLIEEFNVQQYLINHANSINAESTSEILNMLDDMNEQHIYRIYDVLEQIEIACAAQITNRFVTSSKEPLSPDYENIKLATLALSIDLDDIKTFLGYPQEFWNYIDNHIVLAVDIQEENMIDYIYDGDVLEEINVDLLPITDLNSALSVMHILVKAYEAFCSLKKPYLPNNDSNYSDLDEKFKQYIMTKKARI